MRLTKKPNSYIPHKLPPGPPEAEQMQQNLQSYLRNTFQGPLMVNNNNKNNNDNDNEVTQSATPVPPTNQSEYPDDNVPPYTVNANDNDMGYYDSNGNFHNVDSAKPVSPPAAYIR